MTLSPRTIQPASAPIDISKAWFSVIRRLKSLGRQQKGLALIKVIILLDESGEPQLWTAPTLTLLEPMSRVEDLLKKLPEEKLAQILAKLGEG